MVEIRHNISYEMNRCVEQGKGIFMTKLNTVNFYYLFVFNLLIEFYIIKKTRYQSMNFFLFIHLFSPMCVADPH